MRTLYGPIDSWRFGHSLGVDPLAGRDKQCPFSCTYCQYGQTRRPAFRRRIFVTPGRLAADIAALGAVAADCVTFAGLGEPTLAGNLGELVATVRQEASRFAGGKQAPDAKESGFPPHGALPASAEPPPSPKLPIILLTGSALIARADVRRDMLAFDEVVAKLDAPDEALFRRINRPGEGFPYPFAAILEGLRRFRQEYRGRLALQMMILQDNQGAAPQMAALARSIGPDQVQLCTPLRPALGGPVSEAEMRDVARAFAGLPLITVYDRGQAQVKPRLM